MLCMTLALGMMFSLTTLAFAGSVNWVDDDGVNHVLTVTVPVKVNATRSVPVSDAPSYTHISGNSTYVYYNGSFSASIAATYTGVSPYRNYVAQAIQASGLMLTASCTRPVKRYSAVVSSIEPSGTYKYGVVFEGKSGTWEDRENIIAGAYEVNGTLVEINSATGTVSFAPTGTYKFAAVPVS